MKAIKPRLFFVNEYIVLWPYLLAQRLGSEAKVSFVQGDSVVEEIDYRTPSFRDYYSDDVHNTSGVDISVKYSMGSADFMWRTDHQNRFEILLWHYENDPTAPNNPFTAVWNELYEEIGLPLSEPKGIFDWLRELFWPHACPTDLRPENAEQECESRGK